MRITEVEHPKVVYAGKVDHLVAEEQLEDLGRAPRQGTRTAVEFEPHIPAVSVHLAHVTWVGQHGGTPTALAQRPREIPGVVVASSDEQDRLVQSATPSGPIQRVAGRTYPRTT